MERLPALRSAPELVPGLLAVAVFVAWGAAEGGFFATDWYPGALFLLGLLAATAFGYRADLAELPRPLQVAALSLLAFAAWSFLSILWADVPADAWEGANRALLYAIVFALFAIPGWRGGSAAVTLGALSVGLAGVAAAVVLGAAGDAEPGLRFIGARLSDPTGYANATAALFAIAAWPALLLASRRETPWPLRGVMLAAAGILVQTALIPQSRGALIVFPIALALYIAIVPGRVRALIALLPVAAVTLAVAPTLLDVYSAAESGGDLVGALDSAAGAIALSALALGVVGAGLGFADRRVAISEPVGRAAGLITAVIGAIALLVGVVAAVVAIGNPIGWADDRWRDFKGGYDPEGLESTRLGGELGNNRYDFWHVALTEQFADSPIVGTGADNFRRTYLRERSSSEEPAYPHSIEVRVLAGTGLIGALLFMAFALSGAAAGLRGLTGGGDRLARAVAAVSLVIAAYWLMHATADWLWSFPAITGPAIAALAIAGRLGTRPRAAPAPATAPRATAPRAAVAGAGLLVVIAAASILLPWGAALDLEAAQRARYSDPDGALRRLDRARALNPLSSQADALAAAIAGENGDHEAERRYYEEAVERDPTNGIAVFRLGALDALEGDDAAARARLDRALDLIPGDEVIERTRRRARAGRPLSMSQIDRLFEQRLCGRFGRTSATEFCG